MADIVVSPLLQVIFEKLSTPLVQTIPNQFGSETQVTLLCHKLKAFKVVLEDAEEQQLSSRAFKILCSDLKQVAYDVEDFLDEFSLKALQSGTYSGFIQQVRDFTLYRINQTLESLAEDRSNFHLREQDIRTGSSSSSSSSSNSSSSSRRRIRRTGFCVNESEVFGREDCGIGKTTLAQLVYNDERVAKHFDLEIWVCVNDDFDVEKITSSILEFVKKRYLLVLDDVWNEDDSNWDKLRTSLLGGLQGSTIIVTTRSEKVASIMGTTYIHSLGGLFDDECWSLFKKQAFGHDEDKHRNLFPIVKEIVKKFGGVPLAARTLGGLVHLKRDERYWLLVQDSDVWDLD
ncbi:putative disease resistance protein RGA3 [Mercurialis annua]|uniref:putative disease resistance protein RGA3 n=1 Tax=Mercurialis annua TaxID=3986 RepID=UPI00215FDE23|nr:putative disease resistance protein RGA3 [Mercurialis annua]